MRYLIHVVAVLVFTSSMSVAEAQNKVVVVPLGKSGLQAVNDSSSCDPAKAGTIRWTGSDFEGCNGMAWIVLTMPYGTVTSAGQVWMNSNLGASRVATSSSDMATYGDLYQWGRPTDGHEQRTSPTITTLSDSDVPGHGSFIDPPSSPYDWRSSPNNSLWQGVSGTNNPCPAGFRLPTAGEWETERASWSSNTAAGAFASPLKLVMAGFRNGGSTLENGSAGYYWSSTVEDGNSRALLFTSGGASVSISGYRALGASVRCIQD